VCILLSTYNGARHLPLQLQSLERQTHANWRLIASDDGSSDETWTILSEFQARCGGASRVILKRGPGIGFAANFLSLVCDSDAEADYFAFCDQDDVWHPEKLTRAFAWHEQNVSGSPNVYCSRTRLIDAQGHALGYSRLSRLRPSFRNALVQNIA